MVVIGFDKRKFYLVGLLMGGFVVGVFVARYFFLFFSLVFMCFVGINVLKLSEFLSEMVSGGENYLLFRIFNDFYFMLKKVLYREVVMFFFFVKIMCVVR